MPPYASSSSPPSWVMSDSPRRTPEVPATTLERSPSMLRKNTSSPSRTPSPGRERRYSVGKQTKTVIGFAPRPEGAHGEATDSRTEGNRHLDHLVIPTTIYNSPRPRFPPSRRDTPDLLPSPFTPTPVTNVQRPAYLMSPGSPKTPYSAKPQEDEVRQMFRRRSSYDVHPASKAMQQGQAGEQAIISSSEEEVEQSYTSTSGVPSGSVTGSIQPVSLLTALLQQHQSTTTTSSPSSRRPSSIAFARTPSASASASTSEDERSPGGSQRTKPGGGILCSSSHDVVPMSTASASAPAATPGAGTGAGAGTMHMTHYASDSGLEAVPEDSEDGEMEAQDTVETTPMIAPRIVTGIMSTLDVEKVGSPALPGTQDKQEEIRPRATPLSRQTSVAKSILIKDIPQSSTMTTQPSPTNAVGRNPAPATSPVRASPRPPSAPTTPSKARTTCIKFAVAQPLTLDGNGGQGSRRPSLAQEQVSTQPDISLGDAKVSAEPATEAGSRELEKEKTRWPEAGMKIRLPSRVEMGNDNDSGEEEEGDQEEDDEGGNNDDEEDEEDEADSDDTEEDVSDSDVSGSGYEEDSEPGYSDNALPKHSGIEPNSNVNRQHPRLHAQTGTVKETHMIGTQASPILTRLGSLGEQAVTMAGSALGSACWTRDPKGTVQRPPRFQLGGSYSDDDEDVEETDEPPLPIKKSKFPFARPTHYRRRRPAHSDSFDQVADLHVASPSSYVKIDPKERTHRGRGLVSIVDAAPPERVDRQICSRHSSPPPRTTRSRTSSTGYSRQHRPEVLPAGQSPSAKHMRSRTSYRDGSRSGGGEPSCFRVVQPPERRRSEGDDVTEGAPILESQPDLLDSKSAVAGWRSDDAAFSQTISRPITPASTQPSTSRRPSFAGAASVTKDVLRRASETLSTLTRAGLLSGAPSGLEGESYSEALPSATETDNDEEYRLAAAILDSTPAYAQANGAAIKPKNSAGFALHQALASSESGGV